MKRWLWLLCALPLLAQAPPPAPRGTTLCGPGTAPGVLFGESYMAGDKQPLALTVTPYPNGDSCTYRMEGSNDRKTWALIGGSYDCASGVRQQPVTTAWARIRLTAVSGKYAVWFTLAVPRD